MKQQKDAAKIVDRGRANDGADAMILPLLILAAVVFAIVSLGLFGLVSWLGWETTKKALNQ